jgi:hypothetical protein
MYFFIKYLIPEREIEIILVVIFKSFPRGKRKVKLSKMHFPCPQKGCF